MAAFAIIYVTPLIEPVDGECPACGFDSLERVKMCSMTDAGVNTMLDRILCTRCEDE